MCLHESNVHLCSEAMLCLVLHVVSSVRQEGERWRIQDSPGALFKDVCECLSDSQTNEVLRIHGP